MRVQGLRRGRSIGAGLAAAFAVLVLPTSAIGATFDTVNPDCESVIP